MKEPILQCHQVEKRFGRVRAVNGVGLIVGQGEFFALLGPSGSGKTTLLRIIAGLEAPDKGLVQIAGRDVTSLPPYVRRIGMVFQDFLLFPHKTVAENIIFPLKMQGFSLAQRQEQLQWVLDFIHLPGYEERYPHQLSAGQKQRVALARGLVSKPEVLLLDEPLANLDRELRKEMEVELRRYQLELGLPFVYVTHNQEEALSMSDRIAVMNNGIFEQVGPKLDIYAKPATRFVASFVGSSNRLTGRLISVGQDTAKMNWQGLSITVPRPAHAQKGVEVDYFLKSERLTVRAPGTATTSSPSNHNCLRGTLRDVIFKGPLADFFVTLENSTEIEISTSVDLSEITLHSPVEVSWAPDAGDVFLTEED